MSRRAARLSGRFNRWRAVPAAALLLVAGADAQARVDLPAHDERSVYDLAGVISADDRQTMERSHRDLREKTGVAIAIVTFPGLEGEALQDVLSRAGPDWGLGREAEDRGVVVAVAMQEHGIVIATGAGVEEFLPDTRVNAIIQKIILPRLYRNDVSHAMTNASATLVSAASQQYGKAISAPAATSDARRQPSRDWGSSLIVVLFFVVLAFRPLLQRLLSRKPAQ